MEGPEAALGAAVHDDVIRIRLAHWDAHVNPAHQPDHAARAILATRRLGTMDTVRAGRFFTSSSAAARRVPGDSGLRLALPAL